MDKNESNDNGAGVIFKKIWPHLPRRDGLRPRLGQETQELGDMRNSFASRSRDMLQYAFAARTSSQSSPIRCTCAGMSALLVSSSIELNLRMGERLLELGFGLEMFLIFSLDSS